MDVTGRSYGAGPLDAARLLRPALGRRDPLRGRGLDQSARIVVQSTLVANEPVPVPDQADDPRAAAALRAPLVAEFHRHHDLEAALGHHTRGADSAWPPRSITWSTGPTAPRSTSESAEDLARVTVSTELAPGQSLRVVKLLAYGWSAVALDAGVA